MTSKSAGAWIKVNDDAHLYLLAEKQLGEDDKVLTSATSNTWSKGSVTVTGGEITVAEKVLFLLLMMT